MTSPFLDLDLKTLKEGTLQKNEKIYTCFPAVTSYLLHILLLYNSETSVYHVTQSPKFEPTF